MPNFSLLPGSLQCRYFNGTVHHDLFHNKIVFNVSIRTLTSIPSMCHQFYKKPKLCTLAALTRCFGKRIKWKFLHQNEPEKDHQFWQLRQSLCRNQFLWQLRWWGWERVCSVELQTKAHTKVCNHGGTGSYANQPAYRLWPLRWCPNFMSTYRGLTPI